MRLAFHNSSVYGPTNALPGPLFSPMGDITLPSAQQDFTNTIKAAQAGAGAAITSGSNVVGGVEAGILAAAPFTGPAAPFVSLVGSLIGPIASFFKGCGATCTQTTKIANDVATATGQITAAYWAEPVRTKSMQAAAIAALQQLYSYLITNCRNVGGQGGQQCVADRQPGGKWDFQAQQIAPIQNDKDVVADPIDTSTVTGKIQSLFANLPTPLLLGGVALLLLMGSSD